MPLFTVDNTVDVGYRRSKFLVWRVNYSIYSVSVYTYFSALFFCCYYGILYCAGVARIDWQRSGFRQQRILIATFHRRRPSAQGELSTLVMVCFVVSLKWFELQENHSKKSTKSR